MGKLKDLASVRIADSDSFVYTPPDKAFGAGLILVKPNLAYPVAPPATVSLEILGAVLRGLRRASPAGRIVVIEGASTATPIHDVYEQLGVHQLLDDEMRIGDAEKLIMQQYPNRLPNPVKYDSMTAPTYLAGYDCVISLGTFKRTMVNDKRLISASLKNLYGLFPRTLYADKNPNYRSHLHHPSVDDVLQDVYFSIGQHIDGAVVDMTQIYISDDQQPDKAEGTAKAIGKVVWGDDMLAVDETACKIAGEELPAYLDTIRNLRKQLG